MSESNEVWLLESPIALVEGEQIAFSVNWLGSSNVANPVVEVYKNGVEITDQVMDSGDEHLISGNVLTLKKLMARDTDGGSKYVVVIEARVNGNKERRKLLVQVVRSDSES